MMNIAALTVIAAVALVAYRHARARFGASTTSDALVQLWRRVWPSTRLSWGQVEKRVLGRILAAVTAGVGGRVLVPSRFTVHLSVGDLETIGDALPVVIDGLAAEIGRRASEKGWRLTSDPVVIRILCDVNGYDGAPRVEASFSNPTEALDDRRTRTLAPTEVMSSPRPTSDGSTLPLVSNEITFDDERTVPLPLTAARITLGRADDVDVRLEQDLVSKHHAVFIRYVDAWKVADLGSTNGTYLNGLRVMPGEASAAPLRHGDTVRFGRRGPTCHFTRLAPDVVARPA